MILSIASGVAGRAAKRQQPAAPAVEGGVEEMLPEELVYLDAEDLDLEPGGDQRILYFKALHTVTAHGYSTFSLYWDEGEDTVNLTTEYYHMRGDCSPTGWWRCCWMEQRKRRNCPSPVW